MDPDDYLAYLNRALLYTSDLNDNEKALIDFNKAIELDPPLGKTYRNRAYFYNDIGDYNKALLDYNKAIDLDLRGYGLVFFIGH